MAERDEYDPLPDLAADLLASLKIREDWGGYPDPHYDEYDECQCPDHKAMRRARRDSA